jgi:hypothetical protein
MIAEKDKMNIKYGIEFNKHNIFSFTDKVVKFQPSVNMLSKLVELIINT